MVHKKKSENQVRFMLADTILALCGSTISYSSEVRVEGLLGVTIDDQEVFLVQINKSMRKGVPKGGKKGAAEKGKTGKSGGDKSGGKTTARTTRKSERERQAETPEKSEKSGGRKSEALTDKSDNDPNTRGAGKRKRKATWKVKLNLSDDHDYSGSPTKDDSKDSTKRRKKNAGALGLVALDSSDSEDEPNGGADENDEDGNVLTEREIVYVNEASNRSGSDSDDDDGGPSMHDDKAMDSSDEVPNADSGDDYGPRRRGRRKRIREKKTCEECQKVFHDGSSLKIHMRIHTGEKPFECTFCNRAFRQSSQMRAHIKNIHTAPKQKKKRESKVFDNVQHCQQCPKAFINKEKLDLHVRVVHLNERPFVCEVCEKAFTSKSSLRIHMQKGKHDPFRRKQKCTCPVCFKIFPEASKLESHIATSHIEIPLVRLVESDGREILGVNVKSIPGLERTLKASEVKQEVLSEAGDAIAAAANIDNDAMDTDSNASQELSQEDVSNTSNTQTILVQPAQGNAPNLIPGPADHEAAALAAATIANLGLCSGDVSTTEIPEQETVETSTAVV